MHWLLIVLSLAACAPGSGRGKPATADSGGGDALDGAGSGDGDGQDTGAPDSAPPRLLESGAHTLEHDGLVREFRLHLPPELPPGAPLVVAMHGYTSSAATLQRYSGLDDLADEHGFVVVYPEGSRDRWGEQFFEVGYDFHTGTVDDVGFVRALVALLVEDQGLDAAAVFATGMSNGGDMSYRLACEAPELVRAIAPVSGCMMGWLAASCAPENPPPVLEIHGTADDVTLWAGDVDNTDGWGAYLSTEAGIAHWTALHGLDDVDEEALPDLDPSDGSTVRTERWHGVDRPGEVWLYAVEGGGHDWPGAWGNQDIDASAEIWGFFAAMR